MVQASKIYWRMHLLFAIFLFFFFFFGGERYGIILFMKNICSGRNMGAGNKN
jgi:hypothetical protein